MRRLALVGALVAVAVMAMGASVAWGDPVPLCNGQPCAQGAWYASRVSVTWDLNGDSSNGGCGAQNVVADTNLTYLQNEPMSDWPDWTYCNDTTSDTLKYYFIQVEISSPTATVTPARTPDSNGWYNHAVAGAVSASSFSGIASCSSTTYSGAPTPSATVSATCTDNADKTVTVTSAPFAYDATPPTLTASATAAPGSVALSWQVSADVAPLASVNVVRTTGGDAQTVYTGTAGGYDDTAVTAGTPYTYTIMARDVAGNASVQTVVATPQSPVVTPASSPHVNSPPLLRWTAVRHATYYNVQLYRGNTKVLSVWPSRARLQLKQTWRFGPRRYTLKPGHYKWYVWPGFGKRKSDRYGRMAHSGTFVIAG